MKRIILALAFMALAIGVHAQGITAANGTVFVRGGSVTVTGGTFTGTVVASGTSTISSITSTAAVSVSASSVTTSGSVAAGARAVLFETSGDFVGNIDGVRFLGNGFLPYSAGPYGTLPAIAYTISAGTLYIRKINP